MIRESLGTPPRAFARFGEWQLPSRFRHARNKESKGRRSCPRNIRTQTPPFALSLSSWTALRTHTEKGIEKQVSLEGASDAAEVEKRIASLLN